MPHERVVFTYGWERADVGIVMASVPDYLLIETAFTIAQWLMVGPLTALAFRQPIRRDEPIRVAG